MTPQQGKQPRRRVKPQVLATWTVIVLLVGGLMAGLGATALSPRPTTGPVPTTTEGGTLDSESGWAWVRLADLPPEASDTVDLIAAGPPYPYRADGETFSNRERLLPLQPEDYYREFTVETPGSADRGARRIVVGNGGEYYWTADHYNSFERIRR